MAVIDSIMKKNIVVVNPDDTVLDAAIKMREKNLGAILVVENGKLKAIFSERDLLNKVVAENMNVVTTKIITVATQNPVSVVTGTHVKQCAELIKNNKFRHLPVVDKTNKPIGIVSTRDFWNFISETLERAIDLQIYQNKLEEGFDPYEEMGGAYN